MIDFWEEKLAPLIEKFGDGYKKELFGPGFLAETPPVYSDYGMLKEYGLTERAFSDLDIHERAKIIAHSTIANIVSIRDRHIEIQESKSKKKD